MDFTFIAERIQMLLSEHQISEYELSAQLGRCKSYINKICNNKTLPSMKGFFEICDYFHMTPEEFFSERNVKDTRTIQEINANLKHLDSGSLEIILLLAIKLSDRAKSDK